MKNESIVVEKMGDYNILKVPGEEPRRMSNEELNEYLKERKRAKKEKKRMLRHASRSGESSDKNIDVSSSRAQNTPGIEQSSTAAPAPVTEEFSPKPPPLEKKRSGDGSLRLKNMGFSFRMNFLPKS